ncbi:glycoside hydrolase [Choiromyces venosus 120613-1]|uniref:beta-N-acetylhexosaminidase n=1 Tax=Choiromyces venosus 120613-1 TaxID=1336337 RepID=A0A3N4IWJ2_9PEZI|nr:glycoside hydrolase [Choiromyces venosus 120613-1]
MRLVILPFLALSFLGVEAYNALPPVPWRYSIGTFKFSTRRPPTIYLQTSAADVRDTDGLTLIPPSARGFAETFAGDLKDMFHVDVKVECVSFGSKRDDRAPAIYLGIDGERGRYTYESGVETSEGYTIDVAEGSVTILELMLVRGIVGVRQGSGRDEIIELKTGRAVDSPAYPTRGFLLDAGRKWYSADACCSRLCFLKDLCTYASFFKFSEFHYHASDNYPLNRGHNTTWQDIYSQFSLLPDNPDLYPLVPRHNESHTRAEFESMQKHCASRGITIIPEIEAPGHALAITKWKPELALANKKDLLNLTHPDTIPTVKAIWSEFLPWFQTKEVHIGADEYDSDLADVYIHFVNTMSEFISATTGKKVRIWGTYEPSNASEISKSIISQHWQYGQSDPVQLEKDGYEIVNSEDWWAYTGLKNDHTPILPAPYPQYFNNTRVLNFGGVSGWQWEPSLYNPFNTTTEWQVPVESKRNKGAIMATWNDNGPDATTQLEAYYCIRDGIPVVGARSWSGRRGPEINLGTLEISKSILTNGAPSQNLDRRLGRGYKPGDLLFEWPAGTGVRSTSKSKGMNYTMQITYTSPFTLSSAHDAVSLTLTPNSTLIFTADGFEYPLRSVSESAYDPGHPGRIWSNDTTSTHVPVSLPSAATITIQTDKIGGSRVWQNDRFLGRFEVFVFGGRNTLFSWSQMAFVAPVEQVRGGVGEVKIWEGLMR